MSVIGVVQMDLGAKGGGEAVCINVLEALRDDHEVTLPALTEPNLDELNAYFNTDVRDIVVERTSVLALWLHRALWTAILPSPERASRPVRPQSIGRSNDGPGSSISHQPSARSV